MFDFFYEFIFNMIFFFCEQPFFSAIAFTFIFFTVFYIVHLLDRG